jgi:hypothetical protein
VSCRRHGRDARGLACRADERARLYLFRENLRRFDAGEPLLEVVDEQAGD